LRGDELGVDGGITGSFAQRVSEHEVVDQSEQRDLLDTRH
jgi:hypothetical protein